MCFFSLHNESPPVNYPPAEAVKVTQGLMTGEAATSATLRAMADCLQAMAYMVDTGGATVAAWSELVRGSGPAAPAALMAKAEEVQANYTSSFDALTQTADRITFAVQKYRELEEYARSALAEGRGEDFEQALMRLGGEGFGPMVERRIELLRKLKMRVQVLRQLQPAGAELLATNNFGEFFLWFMQPIRDMSIAVHELYAEAVRGALTSHRAMFQTCQFVGEELPAELLINTQEQMLRTAAALDGPTAQAAVHR